MRAKLAKTARAWRWSSARAHLAGADDRLVLDFNFAYNPSCAYDVRWGCPLAPPSNVLRFPVPVGERSPALDA